MQRTAQPPNRVHTLSRRGVLIGGATAAFGSTAGCLSLFDRAAPIGTVRASAGIDGQVVAEVANDDGKPSQIIVTFKGRDGPQIEWEHLRDVPRYIEIELSIGGDVVMAHDDDLETYGRTDNFSLDEEMDVDVFEDTSLTPDDFHIEEPQDDHQFPLEIGIRAELEDEDGNVIGQVDEVETGYIRVENTSEPDDDDDDDVDTPGDDNGEDDDADEPEPSVSAYWPVSVEAH